MLFSCAKKQRNTFAYSSPQCALRVPGRSAKEKQSPLGPSLQKGGWLIPLAVGFQHHQAPSWGPENWELLRGNSREKLWSWPTQLQIWCLFFPSSRLEFTYWETIFPGGREPWTTPILLKPMPCLAAAIFLALSKAYGEKKHTMSELEGNLEIILCSLSFYK